MADIKILDNLDNMKKIMFNDKYGLTAAVLIDKISGKGTWSAIPTFLHTILNWLQIVTG